MATAIEAYKKRANGKRQKRRGATAASRRVSPRHHAKAAPSAAKGQSADVVTVVTSPKGHTPQHDAKAALKSVSEDSSASHTRFLQTWHPDSRQLVFGCGDGQHGVLVSSSGDIAVATTGITITRLTKSNVERCGQQSVRVQGRQLFESVSTVLINFAHFEDERIGILIDLWVIGTYVYTVFSHYGYLFLHSSLPRSGKTRVLEVISHLAFEATQPLNAPTTPTIRDTASEGGTLQLDTLERWRGKSAEAYSAAMEFLDAGFRNGGVVMKMVALGDGNWRKVRIPVYAPYAMAAIAKESLTDTALDRSFVIEAHRKPVKVRKRRYNHFACEIECKPIRDDLYAWALQNAEVVASIYDSAELESTVQQLGLNDRAADIWKPLLAIAQALDIDGWAVTRLRQLATEMGGDNETLEDRRKLEIVLVLQRLKDDSGKVKGTTGDLMKFLADHGFDSEGVNLHALLDAWGFTQKSVRLPTHGGQPRRAWELAAGKLKVIENELDRDAEVGINGFAPRGDATTARTPGLIRATREASVEGDH